MMIHKSQVMSTLCIAIMLLSVGVASASNNRQSRQVEITVEIAFHHLGDGVGFPSYVVPDAEGTYWETIIWLRRSQLRRASTAHLELFLFDNSLNNVLINGKPYALPNTDAVHGWSLPSIGKTIIPLPLGLFHKGANTIAFQTNDFPPSGGPDDFEFGDVVLVLNK